MFPISEKGAASLAGPFLFIIVVVAALVAFVVGVDWASGPAIKSICEGAISKPVCEAWELIPNWDCRGSETKDDYSACKANLNTLPDTGDQVLPTPVDLNAADKPVVFPTIAPITP